MSTFPVDLIFMRLSKRGEYALRALIDLGIARELGRPMLTIGELAEKERLPKKFLEQVLVQLKGGGYLDSKRGPRGGYFLRKSMKEIHIGDVVRMIDGPLAPIRCVSRTAYQPCTCPDPERCGLRILMEDVRSAISGILDRCTLADVVRVTLRGLRRDGVAGPFRIAEGGKDSSRSRSHKGRSRRASEVRKDKL